MNKKTFIAASALALAAGIAALASAAGWVRSAGTPAIQQATRQHTLAPAAAMRAPAAAEAEKEQVLFSYPSPTSDDYVVFDANGDANGAKNAWALESVNDYDLGQIGRFTYTANKYSAGAKETADDWVFVPVNVDYPADVEIQYIVKSQNTQDHQYDVHFGNAATVEAMTQTLGEYNCNGGSSAPATVTVTASAPAAGTYYVGFHTTYGYTNGNLYIYSINAWQSKAASTAPAEPVTEQILAAFPSASATSDEYVIVDANGDANGTKNAWSYETYNDYDLGTVGRFTYYAYKYGEVKDYADDWLFVPLNVTAPAEVEVTFTAKGQNTYDHTYEVYFGAEPTVEAMTQLLGSYNANGGSSVASTETVKASAAAAGTYYVAFRATYYKENGKLYINDINAWQTTGGGAATLEPGTEVLALHPTEEEFGACTIVDGNADGVTIQYYYAVSGENGENVFDWPIYYNNKDNGGAASAADEWLITPAMELTAIDNLYQLQIDARVGATGVAEAFDVYVGTAPTVEAMTQQVLDQPRILNTDFATYAATFGIQQAGAYYVGVHIKSPLSGWRIMLRDLKVTYTDLSAEVPVAVADLAATPNAEGELKATVAFTMPATTVNGLDIPADAALTALISVNGEAPVEVSGTAGAAVSAEVPTASGVNTIGVKVANANGAGPEVKTSARCGLDVPCDPVVSYAESADNMSVTLTWPAVADGANDGIVKPEGVTYNVYKYFWTEDADGIVSAGWALAEAGNTSRTYTYTATDPTQQLYEFMVTAENAAGESAGSLQGGASVRLGQLYSLPFAEDYSAGNINYQGYTIEYPGDDYAASWGFLTASAWAEGAGNIGTLGGMSSYTETVMGQIALPKFSLAGTHDLVVNIRAWIDELTAPTEVMLYTYGGQYVSLGAINPGSDGAWRTFKFAVPAECCGQPWGSLVFRSTFKGSIYCVMINSIAVRQLADRDLSLYGLEVGPCRVGEPATVKATVANLGAQGMDVPQITATVKTADGEIATFALTPDKATLATDEETVATGAFTVGTADCIGQVAQIAVSLPQGADDVAANDKAEAAFRIGACAGPVVTDLTAALNEAGDAVVLNWTNPAESEHVESFEYLEHGSYASKLGDWTNIDFDRRNVWGMEDADLPAENTPKAFQVINCSALNAQGFSAVSGDQILMVFSAMEAASDDWLISPEINTDKGFSFWTQVLSTQYAESLEVLASTTDDELDSFTLVESMTLKKAGWTKHVVDLPAGTRYVALHYCSNDQFGLMLDDFAYEPASQAYDIKGFNVYCNGAKIADKAQASTYAHAIEAWAQYKYNVSVVATGRDGVEAEHPLSNTAALDLSGIQAAAGAEVTVTGVKGCIILTGCAAQADAGVYTAAGALVARATVDGATVTVPVPAGVYVLTLSGRAYKVVVK